MKKSICILVCFIIAFCCLFGCNGKFITVPPNNNSGTRPNDSAGASSGNQNSSNTPDSGNEDSSVPDGPVILPNDYTIAVYYNNMPFDPGKNVVEAVWVNGIDEIVVPLDRNGKANAGELDGEYHVYLTNLPEGYIYNPNLDIYYATAENRAIDIDLVTICDPDCGDGSGLYISQGCYGVSKNGVYRATVKNKKQSVYYEYTPIQTGWYYVESWVNVVEDRVCPTITFYQGNTGWKREHPEFQPDIISGNGFAQNFLLKIDCHDVGNCWTFDISAISSDGKYPVDVFFEIKYMGETQGDSVEITVDANEAAWLPVAADSNEKYNYADLGTKLFSGTGSLYRFNESEKVYMVYDKERYPDTDGWGPYLCCEIKMKIPCCSNLVLYNNSKLKFVEITVSYTYITYDYTGFINAYSQKCNKDGVCYVNEELKDFLFQFAKNAEYANGRGLWTDMEHVSPGTPEANNYSATQDDLWLFACGFYEDGR